MAATAPEVHVKAIVKALDKIGASADAVTAHATTLSKAPLLTPAGTSNAAPAGTPK
jgi:hypothetical protein